MQLHGFLMPGLQICKENPLLQEIRLPVAARNNETMSNNEHKGALLWARAEKAESPFIITIK